MGLFKITYYILLKRGNSYFFLGAIPLASTMVTLTELCTLLLVSDCGYTARRSDSTHLSRSSALRQL